MTTYIAIVLLSIISSSESATCISAPPHTGHGVYVCDHANSVCTLKCSLGYEPAHGRDTTHCGIRNRWLPHLSCDEVNCLAPHDPAHGRYTCSSSNYQVGSFCTLSCDTGYQIDVTSSSQRVICQNNRTWTDTPTCTDPSCTSHPTVANGVYVCNPGTQVSGSKCQLYCSSGHQLVGDDIITCRDNHQWSSPAKCAEAQCPEPPELQDGVYVCPSSSYSHGMTCQLECAAGHRPVTDNTNITCTADETWSPATSCAEGCAHGSFVKLDPLGAKLCEICPVGTYQSKADSPSCDPCPAGWTTFSTGSASPNSCMGICHPGTFSSTGLEPCHLCRLGTYQNMTGGQDCDQCPEGQTTQHLAATGITDCTDI